MKKNNKKGFTIVELVIVIAVIAILSAVLIPTFSGIVKKARISADTQLVREMNTALAAESASEAPTSFEEALDILLDYGFVVGNLNAKADGNYLVWERSTNQILYVDNTMKVIYAAKDGAPAFGDTWYIAVNDSKKANALPDGAQTFSAFEAPKATEVGAVYDNELVPLYNALAEDKDATEDMYVKISTNGFAVEKLVVDGKEYTTTDTFKFSVGQNKFITFNAFYVENGSVYVATPIVAFDGAASFAVVDGDTLTIKSSVKENVLASQIKVYLNKQQEVVKNAEGKYVLNLAEGTKNNMFAVAIPGLEIGTKIMRKNENGYGFTEADRAATYAPGAESSGCYGAYIPAYNTVVDTTFNGREYNYELYVSGFGYVSFTVVINVVA